MRLEQFAHDPEHELNDAAEHLQETRVNESLPATDELGTPPERHNEGLLSQLEAAQETVPSVVPKPD